LSVFDFSFDDDDLGNSIPPLTVSAFLSFGIDLLLLLLILVELLLLFVVVVNIELGGVALIDAVIRVLVELIGILLLFIVDDDDVVVVVVLGVVVVNDEIPLTILFVFDDNRLSSLLIKLELSSLLSILILKLELSKILLVVPAVDDVVVCVGFVVIIVAALVGVNCDNWILRLFIGVVPVVVALLWNLYGIFSLFTSSTRLFNLLEFISISLLFWLLVIIISSIVVKLLSGVTIVVVVFPFISWFVWFNKLFWFVVVPLNKFVSFVTIFCTCVVDGAAEPLWMNKV